MILIFLSGKGGVGKSTLAKMMYLELTSRGHVVNCKDGDPQQHLKRFVESRPNQDGDAAFTLVDTQGAWTVDNIELLKLVKAEDHRIIIPFKSSNDDLDSAATMYNRLKSLDALDHAVFVANETASEFDADAMRYMKSLRDMGANVSKWQFQDLKAFTRVQPIGKAKKQVQRFLHEQNIGG